MAETTYLDAIRQAQAEEMEHDARVMLMGAGIRRDVPGTAAGFAQRFGARRVHGGPVTDDGFIGAANVAARRGRRPIVDVTGASFLFPAMDQVCAMVSRSRYYRGGLARLPLVIRSSLFQGDPVATQEAQRPYPVLLQTPGLKVIAPSNARDMKGLLKAAVRDDAPVLSFEDAACWSSRCDVPEDAGFLIPLGKGKIRRKGSDITVIAVAGAVDLALEAADMLGADGLSVEVIDPRTLVPLDRALIARSVRKTGRVLCIDPAHASCSIAGGIADLADEVLRAPVVRMAMAAPYLPPSPYPGGGTSASVLRIVDAARRMVGAAALRSRAA